MLLCYVLYVFRMFYGLRNREAPFVLSQDVSVRG